MSTGIVHIASALILLAHLTFGLVIPNHFGTASALLDKRIINGFLMPQLFAPYAVSLLKRTRDALYVCGGSLISDEYVITAAHCVVDSNSFVLPSANISIGYGNNDKKKQVSVTTTNVTVHPSYVDGKNRQSENDIAILRIPRLTFNETTQRIPIYSGNIDAHQSLMAIGWGGTEPNATYTSILRGVVVKTGGSKDCSRLISDFQSNNGPQICTLGKLTPNQSTCGGDSGSSVVIGNGNNQMLAGLDSIAMYTNSTTCGVSTSAHFYVHPYYHIGFIMETTGLTMDFLTNVPSHVGCNNADDNSQNDNTYDILDDTDLETSDLAPTAVTVTKTIFHTPTPLTY